MKEKILIADDDIELVKMLRTFFELRIAVEIYQSVSARN